MKLRRGRHYDYSWDTDYRGLGAAVMHQRGSHIVEYRWVITVTTPLGEMWFEFWPHQRVKFTRQPSD